MKGACAVIILYLALLAAAALFWLLYKGNLAFMLLAALILLPVLLLLQLAVSVHMFKAKAESEHITVFKGNEGEAGIRLTNSSIFPIMAKLRLRTAFMPTGEESSRSVTVPVPAHSYENIRISISSEHCGRTDIFVDCIRISDVMGIFSCRLYKKKLSATVYTVPKISEKFSYLAKHFLSLGNESDDESSDRARLGAPGDVSGFREFAPGDRLSLMHYKLSARFDKDIVKVLTQKSCSRYLLTADLSIRSGNLSRRDDTLCRLMSCAYYLNAEGAEVYAAVPADSACDGIYTENGLAARYTDDASYFLLAEALCASDFEGVSDACGFIVCDVGKENE